MLAHSLRRRGVLAFVLVLIGAAATVDSQSRPAMTTEAEFLHAMEELSNWGRWGADDGLGAANLITPAKRKAAAALVTEGRSVSLAHDIIQAPELEGQWYLDRQVVNVSETGASDRYQYTGTYHGVIHSHLDSVACHVMYDGKSYNGVTAEQVREAEGCPQGSIHELREGIFTRGILFDATLLPGNDSGQGWVEPGTAIRAADLEELERIQGVRVEPGDVILLHTGRWKRRAALGPWNPSEEGRRRLPLRRGVLPEGAGRLVHRPRHVERRVSARVLRRRPAADPPPGARRARRRHLRQPGLRRSGRDGPRARPLRVPVRGRAASHREGHGVAAQPDRHVLTREQCADRKRRCEGQRPSR